MITNTIVSAFLGGLLGSLFTGIFAIWRYHLMIVELQRRVMTMVSQHDQIVKGLIERLKLSEEAARRDH